MNEKKAEILEVFKDINYAYNDCTRYDTLKRMLDELTADVRENVKGEWISDRLITTSGGTYGVKRCSNCEHYYQDIINNWNYCPNCGAEMSMRGEV